MKYLIKKYFYNFLYFYQFLGYRIFVSVFLSITLGVLDGFGLAMFLPLLKMTDQNGTVQSSEMDLGKLGFIFNKFNEVGTPITLTIVLMMMVIFFLLKGVAKYFGGVYSVFLKQFFIKKLRLRMLNLLNRLNFRKFISSDVGRIQNTMSGEVDRVSRGFSVYFQTFEQLILVIVYIGFAFVVDTKFAALVTIGGLFTNIFFNAFYKLTKSASSKLTIGSNLYQGQIIQHVGNYKYLKATALLTEYSKKLIDTINLMEGKRRQMGLYSSLMQAAREPLLIIIVAIVILIQIKLMSGSIGAILISLLFFYRALTSLTGMQTSWNKFLETSGSIVNLQLFHKELVENTEENGKGKFDGFKEKISLNGICVKYGDLKVLNNISLDIYKKECIAFVGESGSGKTTLVNVLSGLIQPDDGQFKIDGVNRKDLDIRTFQRRLGYVTQEPVIFNDTVFNNITFWAEPTVENKHKFQLAIEKASISDFIESLQKKEESVLGINGVNISGGQKQRISIARELFKEIDILILDEATSALDTETEKFIQESIDKLKGDYTIIMVAHRLSTVKNADRIAILSKGEIQDIDTFNGLKDKNLIFKRMVELQGVS